MIDWIEKHQKKALWFVAAAVVATTIFVAYLLVLQYLGARSVSYEEAITGSRDGRELTNEQVQKAYKSAIAQLTRSIEKDPSNIVTHQQLASLQYNTGNFAAAIKELQKSAELSPEDAQLHLALANTLRDAGRVEEAEQMYRETIKLDPKRAIVYANLAILLREKGDTASALLVLQDGLVQNSGDAVLLELLNTYIEG